MMETKNSLGELYQTADFVKEKHVPVIEAPDTVKKGEMFSVTVSVGKAIAHPNTTQHHIQSIMVYFMPQGGKYPYEIGRAEFLAHGSSVEGADTSTVYTNHSCTLQFKTDKPGTIYASAVCNIHGLWQSSKDLMVE